jgi:RNA polymerase sigma-70 factor (ECF subfamily)
MTRGPRPTEPEIPDEALMARYADGDGEAFTELFRRYEPRAYAYFLRRTGAPERAQDLYQELFLRIHRARAAFDPARPFAPWLFQIAHRLLVDDLRRAHRAHELPSAGRDWPCERRSDEERLGDRELLGRALSELSEEDRHILVSSKLDGVGYPELAAQLGKSASAVRKAASRALQRLRGPRLGATLAPESR